MATIYFMEYWVAKLSRACSWVATIGLFLGFLYGVPVQANSSLYEFRSCDNLEASLHTEICMSQCVSFGLSLSSFEVDLPNQRISEIIWVGRKRSSTNLMSNCDIKDLENWRCWSESKVMGGEVRKDVFTQLGKVFVHMQGSGGEQYLCSIKKE